MITPPELVGVAVGASALTTAWHEWHRHRAAVAAKQDGCEHPPEAQQTLRINNILTMNPALLHAVIPGRRWLVKHCLVCGKQVGKYRGRGGHLQPYDEFVAEYEQETRDREAQFKARTAAHKQERAWAEAERMRKRAKG